MWHIFQAIRYLCRKVHREKRQEVWRIGKPAAPVGMVLCARSPLPLFAPNWTKTSQTVSNTLCQAPQDSSFGKKAAESAKNSRPERTSRDHVEWIKFGARR